MGMPRVTKFFAVFVNAEHAADATKYSPPALKMKTEEFRAGAMVGEVDIDMGLDKLECSITTEGHNTNLLKAFGGLISGTTVRLVEMVQADDTAEATGVEYAMRGRFVEQDKGNTEAGKKTEHEHKFVATYFKHTDNGQQIAEVDMLSSIYSVNGEDRMEKARSILGIA